MTKLTLGGVEEDKAIAKAMRKHQKGKQAKRKAQREGDKRRVKIATKSMAKAVDQMLAAGAISLQVAARPSEFIWGSWSKAIKDDYLDRMEEAKDRLGE